jgi:hypothetical protein
MNWKLELAGENGIKTVYDLQSYWTSILESSCFARQRFCAAIFAKIFHAKKVFPARLTYAKCEWWSYEPFRWVRGLNLESLKCHFLDFGGKILHNSDGQKTLVKLVKLSITHRNSCYIVLHVNILGSKVNSKIRSILILMVWFWA